MIDGIYNMKILKKILPILPYPHPILLQKSLLVERFQDEKLQNLIDDMIETLYSKSYHVGLAAPQIGVAQRLAVIDVSRDRNELLCIVNPMLISQEGHCMHPQGCLSLPGVDVETPRAEKVTVRYQDRLGMFHEQTAEGLLSYCLQHEMDHLDGKLICDYLSPLKRKLLLAKFARLQQRRQKKS